MAFDYQILLYYKYIDITDPESLAESQKQLCKELNLTGRIIISKEGINGTVEGKIEDTEEYIKRMTKDSRFNDIHWKKSEGDGNSFPKVSIKVRDEIVSLHLGEDDFSPTETTGKYITAEELYEWLNSDKEFYIIDMRNDYEHKIGYFQNSILAPLQNFRDLPDKIHELDKFKNKTVVTVCTGGVRCEKASGFLVKNGFEDVYQLYGGIVTFMEKYPNEFFKGKLYVFDSRTRMGFNVEDPNHEVVGSCDKCGAVSDNYIDCAYIYCKGHRHILCCENCMHESGIAFCSDECEKKYFELNIPSVSLA